MSRSPIVTTLANVVKTHMERDRKAVDRARHQLSRLKARQAELERTIATREDALRRLDMFLEEMCAARARWLNAGGEQVRAG